MKEATDPIVLAATYRLMATIFRQNAEILHTNLWNDEGPSNTYLILPFYYLTSHAAELLLKCALLKRGLSEQNLKTQSFRHDLQGLLNALQNAGCTISAQNESTIISLSEQHKKHDLRYGALLEGTRVCLPQPEHVFSALDEILMLGRLSKKN